MRSVIGTVLILGAFAVAVCVVVRIVRDRSASKPSDGPRKRVVGGLAIAALIIGLIVIPGTEEDTTSPQAQPAAQADSVIASESAGATGATGPTGTTDSTAPPVVVDEDGDGVSDQEELREKRAQAARSKARATARAAATRKAARARSAKRARARTRQRVRVRAVAKRRAAERRRAEAAAAAAAPEPEAAPSGGNYAGMTCSEIGMSFSVTPGSDPEHDADGDGDACESQ